MKRTLNTRGLLLVMGSASALSACAVENGSDITTISQRATTDCSELTSWEGNNWRLSFSEGDVIEHKGERYQANVDISYPNSECAPDAPTSWCTGWFTHLGECGEASLPTCDDGIQNQDETGVDCGGSCEACPVEETCDDGVQNQDETGIDCGGSCEACPVEETCDDGVQNQDEEGVDCGGSCEACPVEETCDDGVQNQDETGIDCGGSCEACPAEPGGVLVPAQIEAEDFLRFEDSTSSHSGDCGSGPVDQQFTDDEGGGCNVGWTSAGEWLEYDIEVTEAEVFDVVLRLAAKNAGKRAQVTVDGNVIGTATAPSAGWQSWADRSAGNVQLEPGTHTLRITFLDGSLNLNWLSLSPSEEAPGGLYWKPGCVEPSGSPGGTGWMDSYLGADGKCYCDTTFDHGIGDYIVDTPAGTKTVREICDALGPGPGVTDSTPIFNDIQCGNGPANDAGDEEWCPGRTDEGSGGCCIIGPKWDLSDL